MSPDISPPGLPLLLLPGLLCDAALWTHQRQYLSDIADIQVPDTTRHDSVAALAAAVLADAPPRFALGGLSMGGYIALEIMRQAPERVSRLALVDTTARADPPETVERRKALIQLSKMGKFKGVTPRLMPMLLHPDHLRDPDITGTVMAMAERVGQAAFVRQQTAILTRPDSRDDLPGIACPTLVIVGRQDALTPPDRAEEMAAAIPGAILEVVENSGHLPPLEQPAVTTALLRRWLLADSPAGM